MKTSNLNPLASSFIPSKVQAPSEMVSLGKLSFKNIANKYILDLIEYKRKKNDSSVVTREDITAIMMRLMEYGDKKSHKYEPATLKYYLKSKFPDALEVKPLGPPKVKEGVKKLPSSDVEVKGFDQSTFKVPERSILLVSLWGLHRQEQALRPMISLTHRPEPLEDRVWSVTPKDLRVWNAHAVEEPCDCPPMFGYSVPPAFFGNPLNVDFPCKVKTPHLNRYWPTSDGNELALVPSERPAVKCSGDVFKEPEDSGSVKGSLDSYLQEFKMIVNSVCEIISEKDGKKKRDYEGFLPDLDDATSDLVNGLWDSDVTADRPKADEILEDDNCHPLLDCFPILEEETESEGVAINIKDLIRRSCSSETTDSGVSEDNCDPPCSQWCQTSPKCTNRTREALNILNDTTDFLLSFGSHDSNSNDSAQAHRPNFKRSFSANDCDSYLEKLKSAPPASTKETLNFLKKPKDPCDSWKDSDSGIHSNCSSQEDFRDYGFEEGDEYPADVDMAPMWSLFSGDGSLWQPLPSPSQEECIKFPHKRVKELRRLQSMT